MYQVRRNSAVDHEDGTTTISGNCVFTGVPYQVKAETAAVHRFLSGVSAQVAFPKMSRDDREFLISSISPQGWTKMFGK